MKKKKNRAAFWIKLSVLFVALAVIHKVSAVLFMALLIVLLTHKVATNKKA